MRKTWNATYQSATMAKLLFTRANVKRKKPYHKEVLVNIQ